MGANNKYVSKKGPRVIAMMKRMHKLIAVVLALAMSISMSATAFAAEASQVSTGQPAAIEFDVPEIPTDNGEGIGGIMPFSTNYIWVGNNYRTIATNPNGINGQLYIRMTATPSRPNNQGYNGFIRSVDILMFDAGNNVIWSGNDVFGAQNNGSLWCGSNVTRVDMRITAKIGVNGDSYEVEVTY